MSYISEGNGPALVASAIVPLVLTWCFSSVRIYVRWFMLKMWKVEDWFFVASQLSFSALTIVAVLAAAHGNGQRLAAIKLVDLSVAMQYWFAAELLYTVTTLSIRLSIGFFLLRICNLNLHIWTIRAVMVLMSLFAVIYFVFISVQCHPISYFWLRFSGGNGTCFPNGTVQKVTIVFSVGAAATDLLFGVLPIFVIWKLQMNSRAKAIVGGLLTLGILGGLTVIIRMYFVSKVDPAADFLFATSNVSIWSMIEPAIGICCMAASTYRPLFKSLLDKTSSNHSGHNRTHTQRSFHAKKDPIPLLHRTGSAFSSFSRSKIGSLKSSHTKKDSFDFEMGMETYETTAEGPGKKSMRGKDSERMGDTWGVKNGIMHTTTVEVRTSERTDDMV